MATTSPAIKDGVIIDPSRVVYKNPITLKDSDWINSSFMLTSKNLSDEKRINMFFSTADNKLTDTSLGGSVTVNVKPQITRYADIRRKGRLFGRQTVRVDNRSGNYGMGRYYSSAYDDNANILQVMPGVPEFQSLMSFATRAVDRERSTMANEGRTSLLYTASKYGAAAALMVAFPGAFILAYGIKTLITLTSNAGMDSYYSVKPTPYMYWSTVNTIVTYIASNLGLLIPELIDNKTNTNIGVPIQINQEDLNSLKKIAPHIFTENNFIDVFAIANRTNVIINKQLETEKKLISTGSLTREDLLTFHDTKFTYSGDHSFNKYLDEIKGIKSINSKTKVEDQDIPTPASSLSPEEYSKAQTDQTYKRSPLDTSEDKLKDFFNFFKASSSHGGEYVNFDMEYVGTVTDTFSNTIKDIPIKNMFNSVGEQARNVRFSLSGGNVAGSAVKEVTDGIHDVVAGTLDGLTAGFSNIIMALFDGGKIDFPKMWNDSSTSIATHTFKTTLISPYSHPISSIQALYIPLASLLALSLPLSTGKDSHTSPFIMSAFMKGIMDIKLGMVKELSITRHVSNLPFNNDRRPLAFDVSIQIVDMADMVTAPVSSGITAAFNMSFDDFNGLNRYLNSITAKNLHDLSYAKPKALLAYSRAVMAKDALVSPASMGMRAGGTIFGSIEHMLQDDNTVDHLKNFNYSNR